MHNIYALLVLGSCALHTDYGSPREYATSTQKGVRTFVQE